MNLDMQKHFQTLKQCIAWESEAEAKRLVDRRRQTQTLPSKTKRNPESSGETIVDLVITESEPSLGGRHLVTLSKRNRKQPLPWNRLRSGTPVVLSDQHVDGEESTGVVCTRSTHQFQVTINRWVEGDVFRVDRSPDEITRKRQLTALARAEQASSRARHLRDVFFGERAPKFDAPFELEYVTQLNESQRAAVSFALCAQDLAIIHGPPGTGKTTTVVELIHQAVIRGQTVLATGPSNTAVDNLLLRLSAFDISIVRLGHPARVARQLQENTLDALVENHENMVIARQMIKEADEIFRRLERYTRSKTCPRA